MAPFPLTVLFVPGVTPGKWERTWKERMPRHRLELRPASQPEALTALAAGTAQLAFLRDVIAGAGAAAELHVIPLYREPAVVVAPNDHPVAAFDALQFADLAGETLLDGDAATAEMVATGVGLAIMPQSVARAASRRDVIARPVTDAPDSGIGLAWPVGSADPAVEMFIGIVRGRTVNSTR